MPSFTTPFNLLALTVALHDAERRGAVLPALPEGIAPTNPGDAARWACDGFDVKAVVRQQTALETSVAGHAWAQAFVGSLVVRWVERLGTVPETDLSDRWVAAVQPLSDATRIGGLCRLGERFRQLDASRREQAELQAVAHEASPVRPPRRLWGRRA